MFTKVYWIETFDNGAAIGIMPRPRGNDWLEDEIERLAFHGVHTIVSLLERSEISELGLRDEEILCLKHTIDFINFPIPDRGLPVDQQSVINLISELRQRLEQRKKIVVHCRMGIGRSSIIAGATLMKDGMKAEKILAKISEARELKVPDTKDQENWLKQFDPTYSRFITCICLL